MAATKTVDQNKWAVMTLRELADKIERRACRVKSQELENASVAFEKDGMLVYATNGYRRMVIEWFDHEFDETEKVVGDVLASGYLDDPAHVALNGEDDAQIH